MRSIVPSLLVAFVTLMVIGFDDQKPGTAPAGWTVVTTGGGSPRWTVEEDQNAPSAPNVLKQSGTASMPLCVKEGISLKDGFAEVKFKPLNGKKAQTAGVVWRYRDPKNYYIVQANALTNKVVLSKVEAGRISTLNIVGLKEGQAVDQKVEDNTWQKLRVQFVRDRIKVLLDGKTVAHARDKTFTETGHVGLSTEADSITLFDDFTYGRKK